MINEAWITLKLIWNDLRVVISPCPLFHHQACEPLICGSGVCNWLTDEIRVWHFACLDWEKEKGLPWEKETETRASSDKKKEELIRRHGITLRSIRKQTLKKMVPWLAKARENKCWAYLLVRACARSVWCFRSWTFSPLSCAVFPRYRYELSPTNYQGYAAKSGIA
jgi:hypothetical protein